MQQDPADIRLVQHVEDHSNGPIRAKLQVHGRIQRAHSELLAQLSQALAFERGCTRGIRHRYMVPARGTKHVLPPRKSLCDVAAEAGAGGAAVEPVIHRVPTVGLNPLGEQPVSYTHLTLPT